MTYYTLVGIAIALAMDAFAVAVASGACLRPLAFRQVFRLSFHFGLFQALMPLIGWFTGSAIQVWVSAWAHWIAFALLAMIGCNMIREAFDVEQESSSSERKDVTRGMSLVTLSVATSIDALAVGLSLSMLDLPILFPAVVIGLVAGVFTVAGMHLGSMIAGLGSLSRWAELLGGSVLLAIGVKILWQNGVFG